MPKILVVDDDKDLLDVTRALLVRKGFEVETNSNWDEALLNINQFNPQVILLDVFLNGIDGLDICRQLKSMPHTKHIPVLIFSGYPNVAETATFEFGADDFISKPFEINDLILKLHALLSQTAGLA